MPDRTDDRTSREPDRPMTVNVGPELQPRCRGRHPKQDDLRCSRPAEHEGPHRAESGESWWGEPYPPLPRGAEAEDVALRRVFRVHLLPADAEELERAAAAAYTRGVEHDDHVVTMTDAVAAAAEELALTADYLDYIADDRGDGPARHQIQLAATVLDVQPVLAKIAEQLAEEVAATREREVAP